MKGKKLGDYGENIAIEFLKKKNYIIKNTNYRSRFGEIDIIARKKNVVVFIEVKTRTNTSYGRPVEAIHNTKISRILKTIQFYIKEYHLYDQDIRIDAIEIIINTFNDNDIKINHIENIVN